MPVVIDGNNLLYAANGVGTRALRIGRSMLCDVVGSWAERRAERVHVVFDGRAPGAARAVQIGHSAIKVTYSGTGVSADAVLADILEKDSAARRLLVISSDRAVQKAAKRRRAQAMRSEDFWIMIERDLARPTPRRAEPEEKEAGSSPEATEQWLDEFGLD